MCLEAKVGLSKIDEIVQKYSEETTRRETVMLICHEIQQSDYDSLPSLFSHGMHLIPGLFG